MMNDDQLYHDWKRRRAQAEAPPGFADRVLAAAHAHERDIHHRSRLRTLLLALLASRHGKIAVCTLAALTCVLRLLHVAAIFYAQ
jgi:hypothetical protein